MIIPDAEPKGLVGYWSFDDTRGVDYSGSNNHAVNNVPAGPAFGGKGSSGSFTGSQFLKVPHSDSLNFGEFTLTFWLFVVRGFGDNPGFNKGLKWCPIIQKGFDDIEGGEF